jgi:hypothetical protein
MTGLSNGSKEILHSEELYNLYALRKMITAIKSRGMSWAGHVAGMGEMRNYIQFWPKSCFILLKLFLQGMGMRVRTGFYLRTGINGKLL